MRRHLQIGDIMISECEHGGLWLCTFDGEGRFLEDLLYEPEEHDDD